MRIQCLRNVTFHAYTKRVGDNLIGSFVDRIDGNGATRLFYAEYNHYGFLIVDVRKIAYKSACKCAKIAAQNHAYIN